MTRDTVLYIELGSGSMSVTCRTVISDFQVCLLMDDLWQYKHLGRFNYIKLVLLVRLLLCLSSAFFASFGCDGGLDWSWVSGNCCSCCVSGKGCGPGPGSPLSTESRSLEGKGLGSVSVTPSVSEPRSLEGEGEGWGGIVDPIKGEELSVQALLITWWNRQLQPTPSVWPYSYGNQTSYPLSKSTKNDNIIYHLQPMCWRTSIYHIGHKWLVGKLNRSPAVINLPLLWCDPLYLVAYEDVVATGRRRGHGYIIVRYRIVVRLVITYPWPWHLLVAINVHYTLPPRVRSYWLLLYVFNCTHFIKKRLCKYTGYHQCNSVKIYQQKYLEW